MSFSDDYKNSSETEKGFNEKLTRMEGESFTPPFDTLGFDQPKMGMDDLNRLRCMRLNTKFKK